MRHSIKKYLSMLLILIMVVTQVVITTPAQAQATAKIKLNKTSVTVCAGSKTALAVKGTSQKVNWSSSNKKIATVSGKGVVTGKSAGVTIIKAKVAGKTLKCNVTVKGYLNAKKVTLTEGEQFKLKLKGAKADTYSSSKTKVATVKQNGLITAVKKGKATITVIDKKGNKYKCKVTVKEAEKAQYTVLFNSNGGSDVDVQTVEENDKITRPEDPVKEGYEFQGWYMDIDFIDAYDFDTPVNGNFTLYAKWEKIQTPEPEPEPMVELYTVTFNTNGGSEVAAQTIEEGQKVSKPADPEKEGYEFKGWFADAELTSAYDFDNTVNNSFTLHAKWEEIKTPEPEPAPVVKTYTVKFKSNGGTAVASQTVEEGKKVKKPANPVKLGYVFVGWYKDSCLRTKYNFNTPVKSDFTLYAKWEKVEMPEPVEKEYTVTFNSNGGSAVAPQTVKECHKVTRPADPVKEGYEFEGWYKDAELTVEYDFNSAVKSNFTLYAKWEEVKGPEDPVNPIDPVDPIDPETGVTISINQADAVVSKVRQSLSGTFTVSGSTIDSIICTAIGEEEDNDYEISEVIIDETEGTWVLEDIRLYEGVNTITFTATNQAGDQASVSINLTLNLGELDDYDDGEYEITDPATGEGYINDILLVVIDATLSEEEAYMVIDQVCDMVHGELVGELPNAGMYQIRVEATDKDGLLALCDIAMSVEHVLAATYDVLVPDYGDIDEPYDPEQDEDNPEYGENNNYVDEILDEEVESTINDIDAASSEEEANENSFESIVNENAVVYASGSSEAVTPNDPWKDTFQGAFGQNWNEDSPSGLNWWLEAVHGLSAWSHNADLNTIKIGIADTGVQASHNDIIVTRSLNVAYPKDHGTHVAGIIGATANNSVGITGLAWKKKLYTFDVYKENAKTSIATIVNGIERIITAGAKVVNDSNGTKIDESSIPSHSTYISEIINNWDKNITSNFIVVQSAGNDTIDSKRNGSFSSVTSGTALDHIIIVGAAEKPSRGKYTLCDFSNYGPNVTVVAPGRSIFSTVVMGGANGDYGQKSGTSMAAPIVTAVASMVWSVNSSFTPAQVKQIVVDTANTDVKGYKDPDRTYHMVNADAAVELAIQKTKGDGKVKGTFVNAINNNGVAITYRIHKDTENGTVVKSGTSGTDGKFVVDLAAGTYVLEAYGEMDGAPFITSYTSFVITTDTTTDLGTIAISNTVSENVYRIVLTWGEKPYDLDSHLVAKNTTGRIHVYYSNQDEEEANLDVDDTSSYGPETITITDSAALNGFTYCVHNYTDREADSAAAEATNLAKSGAEVKLYKGNSVKAIYHVPTNRAGTVWNVFNVDAQGNIHTINSFEYISSPESVGSSYVN